MFSVLRYGWMRYFVTARTTKISFKNLSSRAAVNFDYYVALGIPKSSTQTDIKTAYYKLSMQYHPDKNQGCEESAQKFREIKQAYEVLSNYHLRRLYDKGVIHSAGQEYAYRAATPTPTATVVEEEDDPATKFYKSRLRKTKIADVSGRTPIYDYDEWSRAHYGYSFQRRKEAKAKFDRNQEKLAKDAASEAHEILLFGMVFAGAVIYTIFYAQSSYDIPKAMTYSAGEKKSNLSKE